MPVRHGIPKGGYGQMSVDGVAYGPADHAPAEQVDEGTQVQPALVRWYVGEIRHPRMVRQGDPEILPEQVAPAPGHRRQPRLVHQPADALAADPIAAVAQFFPDLPRAVDTIALVEDVLDLRRELTILRFP